MLSGLSEDYSPMIRALENANVKLTNDFVKAKLLQDTKLSGNSSSDDICKTFLLELTKYTIKERQ